MTNSQIFKLLDHLSSRLDKIEISQTNLIDSLNMLLDHLEKKEVK